MRSGTAGLLRHLAQLYPCIVVSGRSREDVKRKLGGIRFKEFIGNHGIEPWQSSSKASRKVKAWIAPLKKTLARFQGAVLENKGFSLSIHYRNEHHKKALCRAVARAVQLLPDAKLVGGKQVINIVLANVPDKGMAVEQARRKLGCDTVIYVGDDETDETAFALSRYTSFLTIRVGADESSRALFYIRNQREIDRLLRQLVILRAGRFAFRGLKHILRIGGHRNKDLVAKMQLDS
jgi:trehalose 6-phosphate phosphatase